MLKKLNTPIKQGMKIGKGIAAIFTLKSSKEMSTYISSAGQAAGAVAVPFVVLLANYFLRKLSERKRRLINYSFSLGITSGSYFGALISTTMLKSLPSSFNGIIGVVSGIVVTSALTFAAPHVFRFINRLRKRKPKAITADDEENDDLLSPEFNQRFIAGLDAGSLFGSAIGASFELMIPGGGIIGSAIAAALAAPIGGLLMGFVPKLFKSKKWQTEEEIEARFTRLKYTLSLGSSYGAAIGAVIGTFIVPVLGSLLGGMIGGGIGMIAAAVTGEVFTLNKGKHEGKMLADLQMGLKIGTPVGAAVGALIGTFLFPGIGTLAGAVAGSLIGCALGSVVPVIRDKFFPAKNKPQSATVSKNAVEEKKDKTFFGLNFSQLKTAVSLGGAMGGLVGGVIGTVFLPGVGSVLGASVGVGIGTVLGVATVAIVQVVRKQLNASKAEEPPSPAPTIESSTLKVSKALPVASTKLELKSPAPAPTVSTEAKSFEHKRKTKEITILNSSAERDEPKRARKLS